jgi:outer membrane protein OmpA-like peptidoglycan-associated protein
MAQRTGKCTNYSKCMLAYRNETITATDDFLCPECKQPLQVIAPENQPATVPKKPILIGAAAALAAVIVLGIAISQCGRKKSAGVAQPTPVGTQQPQASAPPSSTPLLAAPTTVPETTLPASPSVPISEEPVSVSGPSAIETDPATASNKQVRDEVLRRIEAKQGLSADEKDKLYLLVFRARGFGQAITIGFASGKTSLSGADVELVKQAVRDPKIQKFTEDPTAVFVILGFADSKGNEQVNMKISQTRADSVMKTLKEKCNVGNPMHTVAMGVTELFGADNLAKNRVVEVWVALP